jgi:hypothetical protein
LPFNKSYFYKCLITVFEQIGLATTSNIVAIVSWKVQEQVCKPIKEKSINYVSWFINNQDIPPGLFGRWTDCVKNASAKFDGRHASNTTKPNATATVCNTKEVPTSSSMPVAAQPADPPINPIQTEAVTAEWLLNKTSVQALQFGPGTGTTSQEIPRGPVKRDFLVPETAEEHAEMVDKLILGGSLRNEAEMIIYGGMNAEIPRNQSPNPENNTRERVNTTRVCMPQVPKTIMVLKISTLNLCLGLPNKKNLVKTMLLKEKINVLCLQDTELTHNLETA